MRSGAAATLPRLPLGRRRRRVAAIAMVRDEADVIAETAGHMLTQVDRVVVIDNGSGDGTGEILRELGIRVVPDAEVAYHHAEALTKLAHSLDADWIVPFDADEVWIAAGGDTIGETLARLPRAAKVCEAEVYNHVPTGRDGPGPPVVAMEHRHRRRSPGRKVAVRLLPGLRLVAGNHDARYGPRLPVPLKATGLLDVRHFPYRTPEQLTRKVRNGARALRAASHPAAVSEHWRELDRLDDEQLRDFFFAHHFSEDGEGLVHDPCPLSRAARSGLLG